jgi:hypothetical protein
VRCFYHQDKDAVGTCKSCGKGICIACAVDLGQGLACRSRCEEASRAIIALISRNIQLSTGSPSAQVLSPMRQVAPPAQPHAYVALHLASHIRSARRFQWLLGTLFLLVAFILLAAGFVQGFLLFNILGAVLLLFGAATLFQIKRSSKKPRLPDTATR